MNILNKDNEGMPLDFPPQLLCFLPSAVHRAEDFKMFCNAIVKLSRRRKLFELSPQSLGASCDRCFDRSIGAMVVMWETQCHKPTICGCYHPWKWWCLGWFSIGFTYHYSVSWRFTPGLVQSLGKILEQFLGRTANCKLFWQLVYVISLCFNCFLFSSWIYIFMLGSSWDKRFDTYHYVGWSLALCSGNTWWYSNPDVGRTNFFGAELYQIVSNQVWYMLYRNHV